MRRLLLSLFLFFGSWLGLSTVQAQTIQSQSFEVGETVNYTTPNTAPYVSPNGFDLRSSSNIQYFTITNTNPPVNPNNTSNASFGSDANPIAIRTADNSAVYPGRFWIAEGVRGTSNTPSSYTRGSGMVTMNSVNASGFTNIVVTVALADPHGPGSLHINNAPPTASTFSVDDKIEIQYSTDGTNFITIGRFIGNEATSTGDMEQDVNLNGSVSDETGPTLNYRMMDYSFSGPTGVVGSPASLTVRVVVDQGGGQELAFDNIRITGTASTVQPPTLSDAQTGTINYNETDPATLITSTITATNPAGTTLSGATVTIGNGFVSTEDLLSFTPVTGITGNYVGNTLTFSGAAPIADYVTVLQSVRYRNSNQTTAKGGNRSIQFVVQSGASSSSGVVRNVLVRAILAGPTTIPYVEDFESDGEGIRYGSNWFVGTGSTGTDFAFTRTNVNPYKAGAVTFSSISVANYWYGVNTNSTQNSERIGRLETRQVDATTYSDLHFKVLLGAESGASARWQTSDYFKMYYRTGGSSGTWQLFGSFRGTATTTNGIGDLRQDRTQDLASLPAVPAGAAMLSPALTNYDFTIPADANGQLVDFKLELNGDGTEAEFAFDNIRVTGTANSAPVIGNQTRTVAENSANGTAVGAPIVATDADAGQTLTYAITAGNTNATFAINSATGQLSVANSGALNFEVTPTYTLTVQVTDNGTPAARSSATVTVNVTNVNEVPVAVNDNLTVAEDSGPTVVNVLANDSDPDAGTTLTVTAVTQPANGTVTLASNTVSFRPAANFNGSTSFTYTISDGSLTSTATVSVSVTPVNDAPVVVTTGGTTTYIIGGGGVAIDNGLTVADADNTTLASATVKITSGLSSENDVLTFFNTSSTTYGNIGSAVSANGTLPLASAGGTATVAQWQAALRTVTFNNAVGTAPATVRTVEFVVNDGTTNSAPATKTVTPAAPTTVVSVTRLDPSPTATTQVRYQVVFSRSVSGLTVSNFSVTSTSSVTGASVSSTNGSGTTYIVTLNTGTGTGNGTLRLNVANSAGMTPTVSSLPFTGGETYTIIRTFAPQPLLSLRGAGSASGNADVTAYVENVQVVQTGTTTAVAGALQNGSFETNNLGTADYLYVNNTPAVSATPWVFTTNAGVARIGGPSFTPPASGFGSFVGLLQTNTASGSGRIAQNVAVPTGTYQVNFLTAQRNFTSADQILNVFLVEGANEVFLGTIQPASPATYDSFTSPAFSVTAPDLTATVSTTSASPTSTAPIPFSVTFSQNVGTTFTATKVTVTGGTLTTDSFAGSGPGPYTFTVTPSGAGTVSVSLAAKVANDANNTGNTASNTVSVQYTQPATAAPVILSPTNNSLTNQNVTISGTAPAGSAVTVYVSQNGGAFLELGSYTATAGGVFTTGPLPFPDAVYRVYATAQAAGSSVSANSNTNTFTVDTTRPTVVLTSSSGANGSTNVAAPFAFTATFSEGVSGFVAGDLSVTNGTVSGFIGASGSSVYTFNVTPNTPGTVTSVFVFNNSNQDLAGNFNTASNTYSLTSAPVIAVSPTTLPAGTAAVAYSQTLTASGGTAPYTFAVTSGALPAGLTLTSGGLLAGTPTASGPFSFTVTATDASAAPGPFSGSRAYSLTIGSQPSTAGPVITTPANNSFTNTDVTISGTAPANSALVLYLSQQGSALPPQSFTATAEGTFSTGSLPLPEGTYQVYATAQSSGASVSANSATITFTVDQTRPSVAISSTAGATGGTTASSPIPFMVTFSESVTGFVAGDLTVSNGTVSGLSGSGTTYTFTVTPVANGAVTVDVPANVAQDAAANFNTAVGSPYIITYSQPVTAAPVVVSPANGSLLNTEIPTYAGTAPAGSTVTVFVDGSSIGTTTAASGNWSLAQSASLTQGNHTVYATAQVTGSAASANSNANIFTVDSVRPTLVISSGTATGTITACQGTASVAPAVQQFSVSGSNLTANLVATAPTNFEISTNAGSGFGATATLTQSGGTVNNTPIYVRSSASASGSISGTVQLTSTGATAQTVAVSGTVKALPSVRITPNPSLTICSGQSTTLTASAGASYTWNTTQTTQAISVSASGPYSVTVNAASGCSNTGTASVTVNALPVITLISSGTVTCANPTVTLTAGGGTSYTFSAGASQIGGSRENTATVTAGGTYTVTVANANGCTSTTSTTVSGTTDPPAATLLASSTAVCAPAAITLTAGTTGVTGYTFSAGATQIGTTNQATVIQSGTYSVTVSNASGCTATASTSVTVNAPPAAPTLTGLSRTVSANNTPLPLGQFVSAPGTLSFSGVSGAIDNPPTANISTGGVQNFQVTQTDANGCTSGATPFSITVLPSTPVGQTVCRSSLVVLRAITTGVRYEWYKNGQSAPFKLTEIASIQRGTATSSLTLVSIQTTASYYCKVFQANGTFTFDGPLKVTVDYSCIAPGARLAAHAVAATEVAEVPLSVVLIPNPVVDGQLKAVVRGATGQALSVELLDLNGQVVRSQHWPVAAGEQIIEWNIIVQPAGLYLLRAQTAGQRSTAKVMHH